MEKERFLFVTQKIHTKSRKPDKYQKHFQAMQQIVHDRSMPDFLKYQRIRELTLSAETGLCQSLENVNIMEV